MNLKHTDLSEIAIQSDAQLNQTTINGAIRKLVENDMQLASQDGCAPKIWECKWYNDDSVPGYPKGYAVWYNTEPPEHFISFHAQQMYNYARDNSSLKKVVKPYSAGQYDLYYSILTGYLPPNVSKPLPPLYDIGDIAQPAQIKISLKDDNKDPPSTLSSWKDFIIRDDYSGVSSMVSSMLSSLMAQHMSDYHFNDSFAGSIADYLLKDMSNMAGLQRYDSHDSMQPMSGFEYVKKFVKVPDEETYVGSVISAEYDLAVWKLKEYDQIVTDGVLNDDAKAYYTSMMSGCANYVSADIRDLVASLTDKAIVDIQYSATSPSTVPKQTSDYGLVSARLSSYNCVFTILPLTGFDLQDISSQTQYYMKQTEHITERCSQVKYKRSKWFRLWSSGKLEYGGVVPVDGQNFVDVDFGWSYVEDGKTSTAPLYDYPTTARSFYGPYTQFSTALDSEYDASENLKSSCRYVVQLSPVYSTLASHLSSDPLDYGYDSEFHDYAANEANSFKNTGFKIYVDSSSEKAKYYQYYVTGFRTGN